MIYLQPHISYCERDGRFTFLDERGDRYFQLSRGADDSFRRIAAGVAVSASDVQRLLNAGVLTEDRVQGKTIASIAVDLPPRSVLDEGAPSVPHGIAFASEVAGTLAWYRAALKLARFDRILAGLRRRNAPLTTAQASEAESIALAFDEARKQFPFKPMCLPDSLALTRVLSRRGVQTRLVIGIVGAPFAAHCWVQTPRAILNESFDYARHFTPIQLA